MPHSRNFAGFRTPLAIPVMENPPDPANSGLPLDPPTSTAAAPRPNQGAFSKEEKALLLSHLPQYQEFVDKLAQKATGPRGTGQVKGDKGDWVLRLVYPLFIQQFNSTGPDGPNLESLKHKLKKWFVNNTKTNVEVPAPSTSSKVPRATSAVDLFAKTKQADIRDMINKERTETGQSTKESNLTLHRKYKHEFQQKSLLPTATEALRGMCGWNWGGHGEVMFFLQGAYRNKAGDLKTFSGTVSNNAQSATFADQCANFKDFRNEFRRFAEGALPAETMTPTESTVKPVKLTIILNEDGYPILPSLDPESIPVASCHHLLAEYCTNTTKCSRPSQDKDSVDVRAFWSTDPPNIECTLAILEDLPIPSPAVIMALENDDLARQQLSIIYAHILDSPSARFPLWILMYWKEVSNLRIHVRTPWNDAQLHILEKRKLWRSPESRKLCDAAERAMLTLPWAGHTFGLTEKEPTVKLSWYLSQRWLSTTHANQCLDILRGDLSCSVNDLDQEIVSPTFFTRLRVLFRTRQRVPYGNNPGCRDLWATGSDLAIGDRTSIGGIANVNGDHWVAVIVDMTRLRILYGDSLGGRDAELLDAISWWIKLHTRQTLDHSDLRIAPQKDTYNCLIFASNALGHHYLSLPLLSGTPNDANAKRLVIFKRICARDSDFRITTEQNEEGRMLTYRSEPAGRDMFFYPTSILVPLASYEHATTCSMLEILDRSEDEDDTPMSDATRLTKFPIEIPTNNPSLSTTPTPMHTRPSLKRKHWSSDEPRKSADLRQWFTKVCSEEAKLDRLRMVNEHRQIMESRSEADLAAQARAKRCKTENATVRQQNHRERIKEAEIETGKRDCHGKLVKMANLVSSSSDWSPTLNVPEVSRPNRVLKEDIRQERGTVGRPRTKEYKLAVLTNWMCPLLFCHIERAGRLAKPQMRPVDIVRTLQKLDDGLFAGLTSQVVGRWIDRTGEFPRWSDNTLMRVELGNKPGGITTRVGILMKYPVQATEILELLQGLRDSSVAITLTTIRGLMVGHLEHSAPEIFTTASKDGTFFRCSEMFTSKFVKRALGWTMRRSTRAGGKIPADADQILWKAHLRMSFSVKDESIPSALLVNSDQTQMTYAQGCHMTYAPIGSKQVTTVGSEEKCAITVMVSIANDGTLLPFQAIYKGSTNGSLPSCNSRSMKAALDAGFLFEPSKTSTYWSTQETMKSFVNNILVPYYDRVIKRDNLRPDQRRLWQIDCWSVHRSDEFLDWMAAKHPLIIMHFVPARMTGLFQPSDVGFQRAFKHSLKRSAHEDVVEETLAKLKTGVKPIKIVLDTKIKTLRDRTPHWLWTAYENFSSKSVVIRKAWEMCRAGEFNLSYESLTSPATRETLRNLPITDPEFFAELTRPRSRVPILSEEDVTIEDAEVFELDVPLDDSVVPHEAVINDLHGTLPTTNDQHFVRGEDGVVSAAEAEEVLVEEVEGEVLDTTGAVIEELGRGKRKKLRNALYTTEAFKCEKVFKGRYIEMAWKVANSTEVPWDVLGTSTRDSVGLGNKLADFPSLDPKAMKATDALRLYTAIFDGQNRCHNVLQFSKSLSLSGGDGDNIQNDDDNQNNDDNHNDDSDNEIKALDGSPFQGPAPAPITQSSSPVANFSPPILRDNASDSASTPSNTGDGGSENSITTTATSAHGHVPTVTNGGGDTATNTSDGGGENTTTTTTTSAHAHVPTIGTTVNKPQEDTGATTSAPEANADTLKSSDIPGSALGSKHGGRRGRGGKSGGRRGGKGIAASRVPVGAVDIVNTDSAPGAQSSAVYTPAIVESMPTGVAAALTSTLTLPTPASTASQLEDEPRRSSRKRKAPSTRDVLDTPVGKQAPAKRRNLSERWHYAPA
ncbi:hypothetical protein D9615_003148 [Tricholomella constricta]|uniref:DDE-1 domain-containing protein n=1 Tax=Tricholomella constricta TaxID=117010 RepID=A0A8H5HJ40_9AGAR|nr:hypothetical protein D9615_003148 [Tricholomella constricta]